MLRDEPCSSLFNLTWISSHQLQLSVWERTNSRDAHQKYRIFPFLLLVCTFRPMSWSSNSDAQGTSEYGQTALMFDALYEQKAHGSPDTLNDIAQLPRDISESFCNRGHRSSSTFVLRTQNQLEPSIPMQFRPSPDVIQSNHSAISTTAYSSIPASYNSQVLLDDSTHAELHQLFANDQARMSPIAYPNDPRSTSINTTMMPIPLSGQLHYQMRNENEGFPIVESTPRIQLPLLINMKFILSDRHSWIPL